MKILRNIFLVIAFLFIAFCLYHAVAFILFAVELEPRGDERLGVAVMISILSLIAAAITDIVGVS